MRGNVFTWADFIEDIVKAQDEMPNLVVARAKLGHPGGIGWKLKIFKIGQGHLEKKFGCPSD